MPADVAVRYDHTMIRSMSRRRNIAPTSVRFAVSFLLPMLVCSGLALSQGLSDRQRDSIRAFKKLDAVYSVSESHTDQVVSLTFARATVTDLDMPHLEGLPHLRSLDFNANPLVTDAGFSYLKSLAQLRVLNLGGTRITDEGLRGLSSLHNLDTLYLWRTRVSDEGLRHLVTLPRLRVLNLWDTNVTDRGMLHIAKIQSLRKLCVGNSIRDGNGDSPYNSTSPEPGVTRAGVRLVEESLPKVAISFWGAGARSGRHADDDLVKNDLPPAMQRSVSRSEQVQDISVRTKGVDWPGFLGPTGNGKSSEKGLVTPWPERGPRIVWTRAIGECHGAPAIYKGRLFFFDRIKDEVRILCVESETGKELWSFHAESDYVDQLGYGDGPRCSPVVDGDRVYAYGADGVLYCVSALHGHEFWRVDVRKTFNHVQHYFGVGSTPRVEGDLLIVVVGGCRQTVGAADTVDLHSVEPNGTGVVAFDKFTGEVRYTLGDVFGSYASPATATIDSQRWCFVFARGRLLGFEPSVGKLLFEYPWKAKFPAAVSASSPVVVGNEVFISEAYGPGSSLIRVRPKGFDVVWCDSASSRQKSMQTHWNTPIHHKGFLFGCSGRHTNDAELRCIEWTSGKVMWSRRTRARSSLVYVDDHFISLDEFGHLLLFEADPFAYRPVSSVVLRQSPGDVTTPQLLKYPAWAAPVISHGLLYLRGRDRLVCVDVIPQ